MKKFTLLATLSIAFASSLSAQVITQVLGGSNSPEYGVEIQNNTNATIASGTTFVLTEWYGQNKSHSFSFALTADMGVNDVIVAGRGTVISQMVSDAGSVFYTVTNTVPNGGNCTQCLEISADHPIQLTVAGTVTDKLGDVDGTNKGLWASGNANDEFHIEREIELMGSPSPFLTTQITSATTTYNLSGSNVNAFSIPVGTIHTASAVTADNCEGMGYPVSNHRMTNAGWVQQGSTVANTTINSNAIDNNSVIDSKTNRINLNNSASMDIKQVNIRQNTTVNFGLDPTNKTVQYRIQPNQFKKFNAAYTLDFETTVSFDNVGWRFIGCPYSSGWQASDFVGFGNYYWWGLNGGVETWNIGSGGTNLPPDNRGMFVFVQTVGGSLGYAFADQGDVFTISSGANGVNELIQNFTWALDPTANHELETGSTGGFSSSAGWNLISNPFTCCLDWQSIWDDYVAAVGSGNEAFNASIYIWDPTAGAYYSYNAATSSGPAGATISSGIVRPGGAVWIQIADPTASTAQLTLDASVLTNGVYNSAANSFAKTNQMNAPLDELLLSISSPTTSTMATTLINKSNGQSDFDPVFDTWEKNIPTNGNPIIYSVHSEDNQHYPLALNCIDFTTEQHVAIGFNGLVENEVYTLALDMSKATANYSVKLEDTYLDEITDMVNGFYTFNSNSNLSNDRFILHVTQESSNSVGIEDLETSPNDAFAYVKNGEIYFNTADLDVTSIDVINPLGQRIMSKNITSSENKIINLGNVSSKGLYLIKYTVLTSSKYQTIKLMN